jgi:hypothetical protein
MTNKELIRAPSNAKKLLISLYHHQPSPIPFTPFDLQEKNYVELHKFRQKVEEQKIGPHHQPYRAGRKKTLAYRTIFYSLGLLFLFLCIFIYTQTMNWSGTLIFVNYTATKMAICAFTFILSVASCIIGQTIKIEKEAANQLIHRAQNKIRRILSYKKAEFGLSRFLSFGHQFKKHVAAKESFHDTWEKIRESKKVTYALLEQIANTKGLDSAALEKLFNQAILELNDKLHNIIIDFKKKLSSILEV